MRRSLLGRLRVWNLPADPYDNNDLRYNFDAIDSMIGGPGDGYQGQSFSDGQPPSWLSVDKNSGAVNDVSNNQIQYGNNTQPVPRNMFSIAQALSFNTTPLGTVIEWWRPNDAVPIPDGWVPVDGRVLNGANGEHSWPGIDVVTLPDLRNAFVLGADASKVGAKSDYDYTGVGSPTVTGTPAGTDVQQNYFSANGSSNAPGIGFDSRWQAAFYGNATRYVQHNHASGSIVTVPHAHDYTHFHQIPPHNHGVDRHIHGMDHVHVIQGHQHALGSFDIRGGTQGSFYSVPGPGETGSVNVTTLNGRPDLFPSNIYGNVFTQSGLTTPFGQLMTSWQIDSVGNIENTALSDPNVNTSVTSLNTFNFSGNTATQTDNRTAGQTDVALTSEIDVRPTYVGLLRLMKVRVATNVVPALPNHPSNYPGWSPFPS